MKKLLWILVVLLACVAAWFRPHEPLSAEIRTETKIKTVFLLLMAWMWDYMRKGGKLNLVLILAVTALMGWAYWCGYEQAGFQEYRTNILILTVTGILTAVCLTLLCFLKDIQIRNVILGVMGVVLVVNVVSEGGTNYQNRVTMKKTDVPAEVMVQEMDEAPGYGWIIY